MCIVQYTVYIIYDFLMLVVVMDVYGIVYSIVSCCIVYIYIKLYITCDYLLL